MSVRRLGGIALLVLACTSLFFSMTGNAQVLDVLKLDEGNSYVLNLQTGSKQTYAEFLDSKQLEGDKLEFNIYVSKTGNPILDGYVLELRTTLDNPEWKFGDTIYHGASVLVWKGKAEHEALVPKIILTGNVPAPIQIIREPGFEAYKEITGIGEKPVEVVLTVGTTRDGTTLDTFIQTLAPSMEFFATNERIQEAKSTVEKNLEEAQSKIGETNLEEDIRRLAEEGHPGWASRLSGDYKELSVMVEAPPLTLYIILSVLVGLILGAAFIYLYVAKGGGKGVDVGQISTELNDTSGRLEEKSSAINALSTKFARSEDEEKRSLARELIKIRASLNEISNDIRTIADKVKGPR